MVFGLVILAKIGQRGLLAVAINYQFIDDSRAQPHPATGVELDRPAQRNVEVGAVEHAQGNHPCSAYRRLDIRHGTARLIPQLAKQLDAKSAVLFA